jgi:hypothetical protein
VSEQEEMLMCKTSIILEKDTSQMTLNNIILELVNVIETNPQTKDKVITKRKLPV